MHTSSNRKVVRIVDLSTESHFEHQEFIDFAGRIECVIQILEHSLVAANGTQWEFDISSDTQELFKSLEKLRYNLQAVIEHRANRKHLLHLGSDAVAHALDVSDSERHSFAKQRGNKSRKTGDRLLAWST